MQTNNNALSLKGFSQGYQNGNPVLQAYPAWRSYAHYWAAIAGALALDIFRVEIVAYLATSMGIHISEKFLFWIHIALLVFPIIGILHIAKRRYRRRYKVQNQRTIIEEEGYIEKHERTIPLNKASIEVRQSVVGRLLNFGDLFFRPGTENILCTWEGVVEPRSLRQILSEFQDQTTLEPRRVTRDPNAISETTGELPSRDEGVKKATSYEKEGKHSIRPLTQADIQPAISEHATDTELERTKKFFQNFSKGDQ